MLKMPSLPVREMTKKRRLTKTIAGKQFTLYADYPTKGGARQVAAKIRREVPYKGYLVRVAATPRQHTMVNGVCEYYWGVYIHDGIKKPWRT